MPHLATLLACLESEIDAVAEVIDLLEQEAELLTQSTSLDALPALSQAKEASVARLHTLAQTRARHLDAADDADNYVRTNALAAKDDALWQAWHTLLDLGEEAHSLNTRNGALVNVHLRHTQQSLAALRAATGAGELYTADGKSHKIGRSAAIAAG